MNHAIQHLLGESQNSAISFLGWLLTFVAVIVAWVFFRATSIEISLDILRAMLVGTFSGSMSDSLLGVNRIMEIDQCIIWIAGSAVIAFFMPNAYSMLGKGILHTYEEKLNDSIGGVALGSALVITFILLAISETRGVSEFLYFNF